MEQAELFGLFGKIGTVQIEREGLYARICAEAEGAAERPLYFRLGSVCERLGRLLPQNGRLRFEGRCALTRLAGSPETGTFHATERCWTAMRSPLSGGVRIAGAVETEIPGGRQIVFPRTRMLPEGAEAVFCFLTPCEAESEECFGLLCNEKRCPVFSL